MLCCCSFLVHCASAPLDDEPRMNSWERYSQECDKSIVAAKGKSSGYVWNDEDRNPFDPYGYPEDVVCLVKPGAEDKLRKMLDAAGALYGSGEVGYGENVLRIKVPSFTENAWIRRLNRSGLVYAASRVPVEAGVGGTRLSMKRTAVYPSKPPPDPAAEVKFCRRILEEFSKGQGNVSSTVSATKRGSCYRVSLVGPSAALALGKSGRWELHEFEFFFSGYGHDYLMLEINHLDSYSVRSPADERPTDSRFFADKDNQIGRDEYAPLEALVSRITDVLREKYGAMFIEG